MSAAWRLLDAMTAPLRDGLRGLGAVASVLARTVTRLPRLDRRELMRGLVHFGYGTLPLALLVAMVTGALVVVQTGTYTARFGARAYLGWAAGYAVLWEFGPLILGLMMAARVGARNAAELATLRVGGQLEGLVGISLDPYALLVAPRVVAMTISSACLAALTFLVAIALEAVSAFFLLRLPLRVFAASFAEQVTGMDLATGLIKTTVFGLAIALVSTAMGLRASGGARAVGRSAAAAVVHGAGAIFALDFALSVLMTRLGG
jgi:phospholipid/cholesterol/gamma-HCH transport system permease protein